MKRSECNCLCHNPPPGVEINHCAPCCTPDEPERFTTICPGCNVAIEAQWRNGLIYDRERYDLIADWLYHRECWDELAAKMEKLP